MHLGADLRQQGWWTQKVGEWTGFKSRTNGGRCSVERFQGLTGDLEDHVAELASMDEGVLGG